jgi:alginate O-acetyltransferase complex protein AlgJ
VTLLRRRLFISSVVLLTTALCGSGAHGTAIGPSDDREKLTGFDGVTYESAPAVVPGADGELFYGADFDIACGLGPAFGQAVDQLARLARLIEKSGRRVVYTVAPNKSAVRGDLLDPSLLPQGGCDAAGIAAQNKILDDQDDPNYLPLRHLLSASPHQAYWHTDPHWTSVGGSVFARALARRLDPRIANRQRYTYGTDTRVGMLNNLLGIAVPETSETALPATKVRVRSAPGTEQWAGYPDFIDDHRWITSPAKKAWPGRTVILGDSFTWYGLENLRPLFRHGRFVWFPVTRLHKVATAIAQADTVVIEVVQVFTAGTVIGNADFRKKVRVALSRHPR